MSGIISGEISRILGTSAHGQVPVESLPKNNLPKGYKSQFPVPFTFDEIKDDIVNIYALLVWKARFLLPEDWDLDQKLVDMIFDKVQLKEKGHMVTPACNLKECGFTFENIKHSRFVQAIEEMYRYAYEGKLPFLNEVTEGDGSYPTWVALILKDLRNSSFMSEWEAYEYSYMANVNRCFDIAELANARCILEGEEQFFYFDDHEFDGFTIRQMALLAGMEEMSIRAAANPKRANPLKTSKGEKGNTYITIEEAQRWLVSKKRYIPIRRVHDFDKQLDIATVKIEHFWDFSRMLEGIFSQKQFAGQIGDEGLEKIGKLGIVLEEGRWNETSIKNVFEDSIKVAELAELLEIDKDILALRYQCKPPHFRHNLN